MFYTTVLMASASSSPLQQYMSAYVGCAVCEFFMYLKDLPTFIMYDDLSKHAVSYREIYLLLRRPPGREAYPGEIFYVHSRLLERSAKLLQTGSNGGGSLTAFPVIETQIGDIASYITTNVVSITDGLVFLSHNAFLSGHKPAIYVGLSVSRVGSSAQQPAMKLISEGLPIDMAQFYELQALSQFASDLGKETQDKIYRGQRLNALFRQPNGNPIPTHVQPALNSVANSDCLHEIPVSDVEPVKYTFTDLLTHCGFLLDYIPCDMLFLCLHISQS